MYPGCFQHKYTDFCHTNLDIQNLKLKLLVHVTPIF